MGLDKYCGTIAEEEGIGVVKEIDFVMLEGLKNLLQLDRRRVSGIEAPLNIAGSDDIIGADSVKFPDASVDGKNFRIERL